MIHEASGCVGVQGGQVCFPLLWEKQSIEKKKKIIYDL